MPNLDGRIFASVDFLDENGENQPSFDVPRDGFTLLACGFIGAAAFATAARPAQSASSCIETLDLHPAAEPDEDDPAAVPGTLPVGRSLVVARDGKVIANSNDVAHYFGKLHKHIMRRIRDAIQDEPLCGSNFGLTSISVSMPNGGTRKEPAYDLDRDGFTLLVMGLTGAKAIRWRLQYIDAFNKMEAALRAASAPPPDHWQHPAGGRTF